MGLIVLDLGKRTIGSHWSPSEITACLQAGIMGQAPHTMAGSAMAASPAAISSRGHTLFVYLLIT